MTALWSWLRRYPVAWLAVLGLALVVGILLALRALWHARAVAASLGRSLAAEVAARLGAEAAADALRESARRQRERERGIAAQAQAARLGVDRMARDRRAAIDRAAELGMSELAAWWDRARGREE